MNGTRAASSSLGTAVWLVVSVTMLLWAAWTVSILLHAAAEVILRALQV